MKRTKEQIAEYQKQYHADHRERLTAKRKENYHKHIEKAREYKRNHHAKLAEHYKEKAREKKRTIVELLGGCCSVCKEKFPLCVYDLHHLNPAEKDFPPASLYLRKWSIILPEIAKCILVCANCHRKIHHEDKYDLLREDFEDEEDEQEGV